MSHAMLSELVPRQTTDGQLIDMWLHGHPETTQRAYRGDVALFLCSVARPLPFVTLQDLQGYADSLAGKDSTKARRLASIKSLLSFGHRTGYLQFDVGGALRLPTVRCRLAERILPEADVLRMVSMEPDIRSKVLLMLLYGTGIRVSELCGLRWRDVQAAGTSGQVTVFGKGGKTRSIRVPEAAWAALGALPHEVPDAPVFVSRKGGPLVERGVRWVVSKAAKRAGIKSHVSPHWFRHAHASHALDRNAPIHLVQQTLGHANINTTGRYLHARPGESSGKYLPQMEITSP